MRFFLISKVDCFQFMHQVFHSFLFLHLQIVTSLITSGKIDFASIAAAAAQAAAKNFVQNLSIIRLSMQQILKDHDIKYRHLHTLDHVEQNMTHCCERRSSLPNSWAKFCWSGTNVKFLSMSYRQRNYSLCISNMS